MKKMSVLVIFTLITTFCYAQKKETKAKFAEYTEQGTYTIDGENIVVTEVIKDIPGSVDDIYIAVKNFFARNYKDGNSVIQTDDKEAGVIIGKGYFRDLYLYRTMGINPSSFSAYHILRVDIKENRLRVICSASEWEYKTAAALANDPPRTNHGLIVDYAPITNKRLEDKGKQMEAFVALIDTMKRTISELERTVKGGSIAGENDDW